MSTEENKAVARHRYEEEMNVHATARSEQMKKSPMGRLGSLSIVAALCGALLLLLTSVAPVHATASGAAQTWYIAAGAETADHAISNMMYLPSNIWIHQGDTVVWTAGSGEPHTVAFVSSHSALPLPLGGPCLGAQLPQNTQPFAGDATNFVNCADTASGKSYAFISSGLLTTLPSEFTAQGIPFVYGDYHLTFTTTGDFTYYCVIHNGMTGMVHVLPAGQPLPYTQVDYNAQAARERGQMIGAGYRLYGQAEREASKGVVVAGIGDSMVDVMRFIRPNVTIHVGQSVTFVNESSAPHTVTFGPEQGDPTLPYGDPTNFTGGPLNSGYFGAFISPADKTYTVTFNKAGVYSYHCALHDYLGMAGEVDVVS
jgi:plastocyanin